MEPETIEQFSQTWKPIPELEKDPIVYFNELYANDPDPKKVNLSAGVYVDDKGEPWILSSVQMAISKLTSTGSLSFGYLSMTGDVEFTEESIKFAYGVCPKSGLIAGKYKLNQIARTQTLSGTGAIHTAFALAKAFYKPFDGTVWIANPTWPIYNTIAKFMGLEVKNYFYYDFEKKEFDSKKYIDSLKAIPENSFVVLHCCGHNPTGFDITNDEWKEVVAICKSKSFLILMDVAYQGFVSGNLVEDAYPMRLMVENEVPILVAQSYAKNMGLYGQRTGCLSMICKDEFIAQRITGFFSRMNRSTFSTPPRFGSDIAKAIFKDPQIYAQWQVDIKTMTDNINSRRSFFLEELKKNNCPGDWDCIRKQKGMFAITQLKTKQIIVLREKYAIYMTENGRISITGLNTENIPYVAKSIAEVMKIPT